VDLKLGYRAVAGWARIKPSVSYLPVPWTILASMAVELVRRDYCREACIFLMVYDTYARHEESRLLRGRNFVFSGDTRLLVPASVVVLFETTKAGRSQSVTVRSPIIADFIRQCLKDVPSHELVVDLSQAGLLALFKRSQLWLGFPAAIFVIHGVRHGSATKDFMDGMEIQRIILRGRWADLRITRRYLQEGQAHLLAI
jgi:integrase